MASRRHSFGEDNPAAVRCCHALFKEFHTASQTPFFAGVPIPSLNALTLTAFCQALQAVSASSSNRAVPSKQLTYILFFPYKTCPESS